MKLNSNEIESLINSLKHPEKVFLLQELSQEINSLFGGIDRTEKVIGKHDGIEYFFVVRRGNRDENRFSLHLRFAETHTHLIRVDFGSGHRYPDGTRLKEDHMHILWNPLIKESRKVIPLSETEFINIKTIAKAYEQFICYTNIEEHEE